jgi:Lactonase, 7-bladed beta-propeller
MSRVLLWKFLCLLALLAIVGCGGGSGDDFQAGLSNRASRADLTLRVDFGATNEVLSQAAEPVARVRVEVADTATGLSVVPGQEISRPQVGSVQSVTFTDVPLGRVTITASFFDDGNQLLGQDSETVTLSLGQVAVVQLAYVSEPQPEPVPVTREFVVVANTQELLVFQLDLETGFLTQVFRQDFGPNSLPFSVDARDDGMVYVTFNLLNRVQQFQMDSQSGALTSRTILNRPLPEGGALSPDQRFFYHCQPLLLNPGSILAYTLDPVTGVPTETSSSPFVIPGAEQPQRIFIHPNGRFLYAAERNAVSTSGVFYNYSIDVNTGALTQIGGQILVSAPRAFAFEVSPDGNTLYVTGNANQIDGFTINQANGTLTPISPSFPPGQDSNLAEMVVDSALQVLYVCGFTTGQVEAYRLDASGRPTTPVAGSPYLTSTIGTLTLKRDPSGQFLLATNTGGPVGTVSVFRIQSDGSLVSAPGSPFTAGVGTFDFDIVRFEN